MAAGNDGTDNDFPTYPANLAASRVPGRCHRLATDRTTARPLFQLQPNIVDLGAGLRILTTARYLVARRAMPNTAAPRRRCLRLGGRGPRLRPQSELDAAGRGPAPQGLGRHDRGSEARLHRRQRRTWAAPSMDRHHGAAAGRSWLAATSTITWTNDYSILAYAVRIEFSTDNLPTRFGADLVDRRPFLHAGPLPLTTTGRSGSRADAGNFVVSGPFAWSERPGWRPYRPSFGRKGKPTTPPSACCEPWRCRPAAAP
jgi:hypothetical protein